ncbi:hypothetical protein DFH07DRAFT_766569 [Mycena maculata]|uniref:Uncharacterized protein n=1 Tax=Mycena maculata TaxID=230809 RepID=A0AAD7K6S6_9AGAR|nr:hypothetical protein DFH07DRAFT_766569 [Mycena maculata]
MYIVMASTKHTDNTAMPTTSLAASASWRSSARSAAWAPHRLIPPAPSAGDTTILAAPAGDVGAIVHGMLNANGKRDRTEDEDEEPAKHQELVALPSARISLLPAPSLPSKVSFLELPPSSKTQVDKEALQAIQLAVEVAPQSGA